MSSETSKSLSQVEELRSEIEELNQAEQALRVLSTSLASLTGKEFFEGVSKHLTKSLGIDYAFVGILEGEQSELVKVLGGSAKGEPLDQFEYALSDTPCENVMGQQVCCYPTHVQQAFPADQLLIEMKIDGYLGTPLFDSAGGALGILVLLNESPITNQKFAESTIRIFADRVVAEIERSRTEEAFRESARWLAESQRVARIGSYVLDNQTGIWTSTETLNEIFGIGEDFRKDVVGWTTLIHPDDRESMEAYFEKQVLGKRLPFDREYRIIRRNDGRERWVHGLGELVLNENQEPIEMLGTIQDITERRRVQDALKAEMAFTDNAVNALSDTFFVFDPFSGKPIRWNKVFSDISGYTDEEISTMKAPDDFYSEQDLARAAATIERIIENGKGMVELSLITKDGRAIPTEYVTTLMSDSEGKPTYMIAVGRDVSERKRLEEERLDLERQMQQAQKLESLGVLAGGIAHDFNNLLMTMLGNVELAQMDLTPDSAAHAHIRGIEEAVQRAAELSNQMLAYSGKGRFVVETIDLNEFVHEMTHLLEVAISKTVILEYAFSEDLPMVLGDAAQLRQILMNLIINASEAIGENEGTITLATGAQECNRKVLSKDNLAFQEGIDEELPEGRYVFFEVGDTGSGMDEETVYRIFDPFFTTKFTGRGIGMAAVLGIVRGHKGAIIIESEVGLGSSFRILLPAAPSAEVQNTAQGTVQVSRDVFAGEGTILIADDEDSILSVSKRLLERHGFDVITAADGREAVDIFRDHADDIVCVLLDLSMPRMGGKEAFLEIRNIRSDVKAILCSGYNEQEVTQEFIGEGLAGVLQKPFSAKLLLQTISDVISS